jgi:hypothetical protein
VDELAAPGTLEDLELSTRVVNALKNNDVQSVQQLINLAAAGEDALLGLAGVGPKAVEEIMAALETARPEEAVEEPAEAEAIAEKAAEEKAALEPAAEQPAGPVAEPEALVAERPAVEKAPAKAQEEPSPEKAAPKVVDVVEGTLDIPVVTDWSEEEEDDEDRSDSKKRAKKKKQRLEYDEALGEVVKRHKRKPGRRREAWEDPN